VAGRVDTSNNTPSSLTLTEASPRPSHTAGVSEQGPGDSLTVTYHDQGDQVVTLSATGAIVNHSPVSRPGLSALVPHRFALDIDAVALAW
jgi:hypothetical protein